MKTIVLYNPLSRNKQGATEAEEVKKFYPDAEFVNITTISSCVQYFGYEDFFRSIGSDARVVLCGGDGTLNRFINETEGVSYTNEIFYYPTGSGNDFANDIGLKKGDAPVSIAKYLVNLPTVTINGKTSRFINGIGYGIDGYCCEVGDRIRATSDKPVNYTSIAIKGLLGGFKPAGGTVTVDGVSHSYKKIWLAPMMNGRYYGGGMIAAPDQDRLNKERTLSVMIWHDSAKLPTLMNFPSIFKGEHIKNGKMCCVFTGHKIVVEFNKPIAAQIDGETVLGVTKVEVNSAK